MNCVFLAMQCNTPVTYYRGLPLDLLGKDLEYLNEIEKTINSGK